MAINSISNMKWINPSSPSVLHSWSQSCPISFTPHACLYAGTGNAKYLHSFLGKVLLKLQHEAENVGGPKATSAWYEEAETPKPPHTASHPLSGYHHMQLGSMQASTGMGYAGETFRKTKTWTVSWVENSSGQTRSWKHLATSPTLWHTPLNWAWDTTIQDQ